eukprot:CAMPEP_0183417062 /NCGR_PEP_ID=MMETSP0370-20130417/24180_1 /TAXON_ID=268820 /ORGANISM="Peridinium aciculiferum, Strain PAER-2" /LENGTH=64 /DNA_ID=CAMNT_0025600617 /DNA_START=53 /DNA_END=243 /DNA_ORIENTATION=-
MAIRAGPATKAGLHPSSGRLLATAALGLALCACARPLLLPALGRSSSAFLTGASRASQDLAPRG